MTTYSNGESFGVKALTLAMIAGAALLLVEVTWPQAMQTAPAATTSVETVTVTPQAMQTAPAATTSVETVTVTPHANRVARAD